MPTLFPGRSVEEDTMNPVAVLRTNHYDGNTYRDLRVWCPGCELSHRATLVGETGDRPPVCWEFDGNMEAPTVTPSLLVTRSLGLDHVEQQCHSFITAGQWVFLSDCTHNLAGQTVPLPPVPDWMLDSSGDLS